MLPTMPTDTLVERLASVLRAEQAAKQLSQQELSDRSGLKQQYLSDILRAKYVPNARALLAILRVLGRDLQWLHKQGITPELVDDDDRA